MTEQVPPQNLDAEKSVLGSMLVAEPALRRVLQAALDISACRIGHRPEHSRGDAVSGVETGVYYNDLFREIPPHTRRTLVCGEGWWGVGEWIIRGDAPDGIELQPIGQLGPIVEGIVAGLPDSVDPDFKPARFCVEVKGQGDAAVIPIGADPRFLVDIIYLHYTEACAEVEQWRWLADFAMHREGAPAEGGLLVGLNDGEPVAAVSPILLATPLQDSEGER